jgi:DNA-binding winged helix-turn-helix (wHTH) protein/tetratricopeptide (TPR) repeat protein
MSLEKQSPAILRFSVFEVDVRAGELRKQGVRIKLQEQPFHVLTVLLQRPGEVVTREELRNQNWPADTFVDFDNGLNTAINKLREALGDSADNPRFIETLPRRGYRFIAPVAGVDGTTRGAATGVSAAAGTRSRKMVVTVAVVVLAAGIAGGLLWHSRKARHLTEKDTIVLGDFANSTGDAVFDGTLREGLSVELEQSPFLSLVSEKGIHQTLRMMGQMTNARLTPEIAREVCQRTNSAVALDGSIALIGTRYNLILKAVDCATGDSLVSTEAQANDKSHVLDALGEVASEMRRKLGESLSTVQKYNTPLEQATTPSLEALQAFSLGVKASFAGDVAPVAFFQSAIQLDPNFAAAYDAMGSENQVIGTALAVENIRKAFELRTRVSEREKLIIEGDYYNVATGDLMKAQQSYILGEQIYPREVTFRNSLGVLYNALGQYEAGLREHQEAVRLAPSTITYRFLVYTYLSLNRDEDAAALAREAHEKGLDSSSLGPTLYSLAFYRNDTAEMSRQVAAWAGKPGQEYLLLALEADTAAYFGHLGRARELSRQASSSAKRARENETSATYEAVAALREGLFGNANRAGQRTALAKERSGGPDKYYAVVLALAYTGDGSQGLADNFNESFPENTVVQFNYLPTLRAKLALSHSNPQQALDTLEVAAPYELGLPASWFYNWPNLYPVYVRGEAYLAAHRGGEAAAEFQKILDHRGIVLNEPIGALAHLQLGRAYAMQGDTAKSRAAYQDFLTLWKDADPDIPILKEAKAEYAKLQ